MPATSRFLRSSDYGSYSYSIRDDASLHKYSRERNEVNRDFGQYQAAARFEQAISEPQESELESLYTPTDDDVTTPSAPSTTQLYRAGDPWKIPRKKNYSYRTRGPSKMAHLSLYPDNELERLQDRQIGRAPMFTLKLRSHGVWEKMYVKFTCRVTGSPEPRVTWYHNQVALDAASLLASGSYKISSSYGLHTLEIMRAKLSDAGNYRASAQSTKGEISSYANLAVRRHTGSKADVDIKTSSLGLKCELDEYSLDAQGTVCLWVFVPSVKREDFKPIRSC
jgi:hypothetical protein